jgi:hypothetical protein
MIELHWFSDFVPGGCGRPAPPNAKKKADVVEHA